MRDIRFRAWDKDRSKMWNTITIESIDFARNRLTVLYDLNITPDGQNSGIYSDTLGRFELMQYTGLKDKNGKEIYEGDFVKVLHSGHSHWNRERFRVYYCEDVAKFKITNDKSYPHDIDDDMAYKYFEIIGNIYEHPELIKDTAVGDRT